MNLSHALDRWGRLAARRPKRVIGLGLGISLLVIVMSSAFGASLEDSYDVPGLDSQQALELLEETDSDQAGLTAQVVMVPRDSDATLDSPEAREALARVEDTVNALPRVLDSSRSVSPDGRVALLLVQYPVVEHLDKGDLANLKEAIAELRTSEPLRIETRGDLFFAFEEPPADVGEMAGLVVGVVVLLLAFGSLIAMALPIGTALLGLAVGITSMSLITYVFDIPSWAPVIASMVGLGVGIDYALFVITRHREFLADGYTIEEAAGRALATAGQSVLFAGGTVVIAILGLAVAGVPFMTAGGIAVSVVVLVMVLSSLTLLPAFLGLAGHRINGVRRARRVPSGAGWRRWGEHVTRHAWGYTIGGTVALLALAAPVLALRVGIPDDGTMPDSRTERRAYDLVADGFGPGSNGPLVIAVDLAGDAQVVEHLRQAVLDDEGIAAVTPAELHHEADVATLVALPTTGPQDDATAATVSRLRSEVFPSVLGGSDTRAHVGGQTATFADIGARVHERLPRFIAAVVLLSFLLLVLLFRSVVVPLKAALLNLLSVGASYGVMVMVFQWGWGADLIGLESTVPIVSFIPMFMFAILFGLSMDYEVFLLSRIREEYVATGDNRGSVVDGIASTARVISAAALIMVSVFLGFVAGSDPSTKMFGLGLATAVLIDATVIRLVLVPALMQLLGDANWWMPHWLGRSAQVRRQVIRMH